ncbi:hypothetical protein AAEX28_07685 [Lentisphaerota bacterium WC36G]|nr:hypothetical protein LJT99_10545 [Lentisphaerae bacterium WC36]
MNLANIQQSRHSFLTFIIIITASILFILDIQAAGLAAVFEYTDTPNFVDLTKKYNQGAIQTVTNLRRQQILNNANNSNPSGYGIYQYSLLSVCPGGMDNENQYDVVLADKLGEKYIPKTFGFSGANFNMVYISNFAWGTENNANNFIPLLIKKDYQEIKQPYYQFYWFQELGQNGSRFPLNDNPFVQAGIPIVGLNYNFKILRNSGIQWGSDNWVSRAVFGSFSQRNAPKVANEKVYLLKSGRTIQSFVDNANKKNFQVSFFLPVIKNIDSFLVTVDNKNFCISNIEKRRDPHHGDVMLPKIKYFNKKGQEQWQCAARAPIIESHDQDAVFAFSMDYRRIIKIAKSNGKTSVVCEVPKYLPRTLNSFAIFKTLKNGQEKKYLALIVPLQTRIYCFSL